jgi:L-iditol 2-dehydrogenase
MKVAVWYHNEDIRIEEVERPKPGPDEMVVKVLSCGICGSDLVEWYRLPRAPLVPGHEIGGEVVETGDRISQYQPGDRVFIAPKVPCRRCHYCENDHFPVCSNVRERLPGGFAEYILVPRSLIENGTYRLSDAISDDQSTFIEPLACVVRSQKLAEVKDNQTVMVIGCGMSGLLQVKLAKTKNCHIVAVDVKAKRLDFAQTAGATEIIDAKFYDGHSATDRPVKSADVVMLCTSAVSAVEWAWQHVDKGGAVVFFAVPGPEKQVNIPINEFWTKEVRILTSYYCGPPDIRDAIRLIETGTIDVKDMITHILPLNDIMEGYRLAADGRESIKVIIKPNQ